MERAVLHSKIFLVCRPFFHNIFSQKKKKKKKKKKSAQRERHLSMACGID